MLHYETIITIQNYFINIKIYYLFTFNISNRKQNSINISLLMKYIYGVYAFDRLKKLKHRLGI